MPTRQLYRILSVVVLPGVFTSALRAQSPFQVHVSSGSATDQRGVRSGALSVVPVLTLRDSPRGGAVVFASATQFAQSAFALTGGGTLLWRSRVRPGPGVSVQIDGSYTGTSFDAQFSQLQTRPSLEWRAGPFTASGGVRAAYGHTAVERTPSRPPTDELGGLIGPQPRQPAASFRESRQLWGPQAQLAADLQDDTGQWASRITLAYGAWHAQEDRSATPGVALHDVTLGAAIAHGDLSLHTLAGQRTQDEVRGPARFASAELRVALTRALALSAGGGSYLSDPVSGALGGRFLTAGVSVSFGRTAGRGTRPHTRRRAAPAVDGAPSPPPGTTRLVLHAPDARVVAVAGDWTGWAPLPAHRARNGMWYVDVTLAPGEYRYAFRVDDAVWRVPDHAVTSSDGLGGQVAWLTVRTSAR